MPINFTITINTRATMNTPTKALINDITRFINMEDAGRALQTCREKIHCNLESAINGLITFDATYVVAVRELKVSDDAATREFNRLPLARRLDAKNAVTMLEDVREGARHIGGSYSGKMTTDVYIGNEPWAGTIVTRGEQYSRLCTYRKNDAIHRVRVTASGLAWIYRNPRLAALSRMDGLPLVDLGPDGAAKWLVRRGKQIALESGWIVADETKSVCYHSTRSLEAAQRGLAKKVAARDRELAEAAERERARRASPEYKAERRARLVARLCGGATATVADARAMGYCIPGIDAFRTQHGIGETATLPELCRTGDVRAVRLALAVARRVARTTVTNN